MAVTPDRRIVTQLNLGDAGPYYFIIDTGAFISGIKPSLARKLKMREVTDVRTGGVGGSGEVVVFQADNVIFSNRFRVPAMAMAGFERFEKWEYDGILAVGFLTGTTSKLDFEHEQITFFTGGSQPDVTGYHAWPARREREGSGEKIYVDVIVDGLKANCLLDTGFRSALNLSSGFVKKHKLWDAYPTYEDRVTSGIHGGKVKTRYTHAKSMEIGGFPISGGPLTLFYPKAEEDFGGVDGVVGMGAIGRFTHIFTADKLYVRPNAYFNDVGPLFQKHAP